MEPELPRPEAPHFWQAVASTPGGESIIVCLRCEACTAVCPVEALEPKFSVRGTIARVRKGRRAEVLTDDALWACTRCFACDASCPSHARPGEIVAALRHLSLEAGADGLGPRHALAFVNGVRDRGRIHEARVSMESAGLAGLFREGFRPLEMAWRGKGPSLRSRPIDSITDVRRILAAGGPR